jgi:hypothetical protein
LCFGEFPAVVGCRGKYRTSAKTTIVSQLMNFAVRRTEEWNVILVLGILELYSGDYVLFGI